MRDARYYVPSFKKILRSLRVRWREFLRENTLHGFPYFVNPRRPRWERIVWFFVTMASLLAIIGIIITIYMNFQSEPTLTGLDIETGELVSHFPGLVLCNLAPNLDFGRYKEDAAHYEAIYNWNGRPIKIVPPSTELSHETYSQFYKRISPECEDLYENCTYDASYVPCGTIFVKKIINRGVCCVAEAVEITKETGPRRIAFDATSFPIGMDLLGDNEVSQRRMVPYGYVLRTGTAIQISIRFTYSSKAVASLLKKQRKCHYPEEEVSYSMCMQNCLKKLLVENCGCAPWFTEVDQETKECTRKQYDCAFGNKTRIDKITCKCYLSCNHTSYHVDRIHVVGDNHVEISIPNWPALIYKREIRFGWLDLLVSFGGIAGLFVGYSLLTTVEFAYYLSLRAYCGAVLTGTEKTIKLRVKNAKNAPNPRVVSEVADKREFCNYVE